jgi:acyl carrier protein
MANSDLDAVVILSIAELLEIDPAKINSKTSFRDDLRADSLGLVEMLMTFEEAFGVEISDDEAVRLETVGDVCDLLHRRFPRLPEKALKIVAREKEISDRLKGKKAISPPNTSSAFSKSKERFAKISAIVDP